MLYFCKQQLIHFYHIHSFVATKLPKADGTIVSIFIYFCPENTPVRAKMTMSSSKVNSKQVYNAHTCRG
jgi:hypothetical protein